MDLALSDKKSVVHGPESAPRHGSSTATCPYPSQVVACFLEQKGTEDSAAGYGLVIGENATYCAAYAGYSNVLVTAQAWCFSNASLTVAVSGDDFHHGHGVVEASCPSGCPAVFCTCFSPWHACPENHWLGSNSSNKCIATIQGFGAKVYAVCDCEHNIIGSAHRK